MTSTGHCPRPPLAPGLPLLGNALGMAGDVQAFLVRQYQMLGPIFRVRAAHREFTVMAGANANSFLRTRGESCLSNRGTMGGLDDEFGMRVHALSGRPHRHLRTILGRGLSRDLLAARWDSFTALTEQRIDEWLEADTLVVVDQFQRLAADQLSLVLAGTASTAQFELLRSTFELVLDVAVAGKWPRAMLHLPTYRRNRAKILAFAHTALRERAIRPHGGPPDLLDHALAATDENGRPYPPDVRAGIALQGYFAGINTVAYLYSLLLYVLLRHPHILERVTAEVDTAFAGDGLSFDTLREMTAVHGLILETLRIYPPAPASVRTARQSFEFEGFRVDEGNRVLVATTVPHHLAEYYPHPEIFDIDRDFTASRSKGVYAPFSVGTHACLGASMTDALAAATTALMVRHLRLRLPTPDYQLRLRSTPGPNPGKRFRVTVLGRR
ncbi:cytochrome P450 [Nocardia vinacea]|uniref:Cytochrome P450 n=1 Tax=Nocardia vinacea TaxID=96468 RepID=A0ABZ1YX65_9NOCA|nr:cytochrome P450 [Nocardia vinacea]